MYPIVVAGGVAAIVGIVVSVWFFGAFEQQETIVRETEVSSSVDADVQTAVAAGSTRETLLANMTNAVGASGDMAITHLYPTATDASGTRPLTTSETLARMNLRAPGGFTRAISDITFGAYRGSEPFIVMKMSSFDAALGGILQWEDAMSGDLAPLFGAPVTATFDRAVRTTTQTREPYFVDVVHANRDMRILRDEAERERIVYSFLDRSTILITTDRTVLEEVAPLVH